MNYFGRVIGLSFLFNIITLSTIGIWLVLSFALFFGGKTSETTLNVLFILIPALISIIFQFIALSIIVNYNLNKKQIIYSGIIYFIVQVIVFSSVIFIEMASGYSSKELMQTAISLYMPAFVGIFGNTIYFYIKQKNNY